MFARNSRFSTQKKPQRGFSIFEVHPAGQNCAALQWNHTFQQHRQGPLPSQNALDLGDYADVHLI